MISRVTSAYRDHVIRTQRVKRRSVSLESQNCRLLYSMQLGIKLCNNLMRDSIFINLVYHVLIWSCLVGYSHWALYYHNLQIETEAAWFGRLYLVLWIVVPCEDNIYLKYKELDERKTDFNYVMYLNLTLKECPISLSILPLF